MNRKEKKMYVPPTLEITQVFLESNMAFQSPIKKVDLKNWIDEGPEVAENNSDVWLNI